MYVFNDYISIVNKTMQPYLVYLILSLNSIIQYIFALIIKMEIGLMWFLSLLLSMLLLRQSARTPLNREVKLDVHFQYRYHKSSFT